jgi:hypothetical protein
MTPAVGSALSAEAGHEDRRAGHEGLFIIADTRFPGRGTQYTTPARPPPEAASDPLPEALQDFFLQPRSGPDPRGSI